MQSKFRKSAIAFLVAIAAALVLIAWFPAVQYLAYRSGLIEPAVLGGYRIEMKSGWYPALTSQGVLGGLVLTGGDKVWMAKTNWPGWGVANTVVISTMDQRLAELHKSARANGAVPGSISEIKQYPWGTVAFTGSRKGAIVEDSWLFLSGDDPVLLGEAVNEIEGFYRQ